MAGDSAIKVLYPGSFDPLTYGHLDIIDRGLKLFGRLTVAVGENTAKAPLFSAKERAEMIRVEVRERPIEVITFDGLVVELCRREGFGAILRGLRTLGDFEYEYQMSLTNRSMAPAIDSVFLMPDERYAYASSSLIKEVVRLEGSMAKFVPAWIEERMRKRFGEREEGL